MLTKMKEKKENLSSKTTTVNHTSMMMPMSNEKQMFADKFFFSVMQRMKGLTHTKISSGQI